VLVSGFRLTKRVASAPDRLDLVSAAGRLHHLLPSSAGFWPGGGGAIDFPAFYSYAYPVPAGFAEARSAPDAAYFDRSLGEFLLPHDAVRRSSDPEGMLKSFLESTYSAAADLGGWGRAALEWNRRAQYRYA
jgi:hypothetical protein